MRRYVRFDTRKPAKKRGLPLTAVVNRYDLLDMLVARCHEISSDLLYQGVEARRADDPSQKDLPLRRPTASCRAACLGVLGPSAGPQFQADGAILSRLLTPTFHR